MHCQLRRQRHHGTRHRQRLLLGHLRRHCHRVRRDAAQHPDLPRGRPASRLAPGPGVWWLPGAGPVCGAAQHLTAETACGAVQHYNGHTARAAGWCPQSGRVCPGTSGGRAQGGSTPHSQRLLPPHTQLIGNAAHHLRGCGILWLPAPLRGAAGPSLPAGEPCGVAVQPHGSGLLWLFGVLYGVPACGGDKPQGGGRVLQHDERGHQGRGAR
mmetsp:Transcript_624/g.1437  ORF Transcript_624/g.1437 Transcript_624/m.1437 type:complete len:212 (-) Transcript_624:516-1151(-)